jgi:hypothetical protein
VARKSYDGIVEEEVEYYESEEVEVEDICFLPEK